MLSSARPIPFGLPAPWVRQYDYTSQTWVFFNTFTSEVSLSHPGFAQPVFYDFSEEDDEKEEEQEVIRRIEDIDRPILGESSKRVIPALCYDCESEESSSPSTPSSPTTPTFLRKRRLNHNSSRSHEAVIILENATQEGHFKDRWLRLKKDRGSKEASNVAMTLIDFLQSEESLSLPQTLPSRSTAGLLGRGKSWCRNSSVTFSILA